MKKFIKFTLFMLFTILFFLSPTFTYAESISDINLIEHHESKPSLSHHFRKTSDKVDLSANQNLNLLGMDKLNISGSGQFSKDGLSLIRESIGCDFPITIIDLREESHGFINNTAVSYENALNNSNKGLTIDEILKDEKTKLEAIKPYKPITFYNTKRIIIPRKAYTESTLVKNNCMNYVRIPVTDGGLPSEEMVNYFIDIVKRQPANTWLHFHCKEGIGRTTTFMIMYDIMKNCNDVSLNDIITRQILISNIKENNAKSFYSGERFNFLNNFYNTCKENHCNVFLQCSINTETSDNDLYIKGQITPKFLYVISAKNMTKEEQTMIATLQGIIATKSDTQIYLLSSDEPDYKIWLEDLKDNYNVKYKNIKDPWKLIKKFKKYIDGYVLYSSLKAPSINNACSLASLNDSIAIDESLEDKVNNYGMNNLVKDCRDTDKYWAYNNLWNSGLNHTTVIQLSPDKPMALRDYAIMSKSLIFYEDEVNNNTLRETIFKSMDSTARCLGWGSDEHTNVGIASRYGVDVIASDWTYNLSVLSSYKPINHTQKFHDKIPKEDNVHYITFIMSDGDNQQWLLGSNYSSKNWYGSPYRGKFDLGWSISPSIYYLAPTVFNQYYKSASSSKFTDNYLVPPSGNGYMYPSKFPSDRLNDYTRRLNEYMGKVDQNYVLILDDEQFYNKDLWNKYTTHSNIDGLLYLNYEKNNSYKGKIIWSNNKPIVSCRDLLWGGLEDESELLKNINARISLGYTDIKNPESYTFVYVHVWSNTMDNVQDVVNKLNENPKIRIVTPDTFMKLIKENVTPTN